MSERIRVILADDHEVVRRGIREFLERAPDLNVIAEATDGEQAIDLARVLKPDVLVLDIQMPRMTGIDVVRVARHARLPCGILMLSAYADAPFVNGALKAGADGYVLKTADPDALVQAVRDAHARRRVLVPESLIEGTRAADDARLTARELDVLQLAAEGMTNKAIAARLDISERTVQTHLAAIFVKLKAQTRTEAVSLAIHAGLIHT